MIYLKTARWLGSHSEYLKISLLGAALTPLWLSLNSIVMPQLLLDFAPESRKNAYLGLLTFTGLVLAMVVQPLAGALSDRSGSSWGPRRPFILLGTGLAIIVLPGIGLSTSFLALLFTYGALQIFCNIAQGPFQGFIPDLIPQERRGVASGVKNLMEALSTLLFLWLVAYLMARYFREGEGVWLWLVVVFLGGALGVAMLATLLLVKEKPRCMVGEGREGKICLPASFRLALRGMPVKLAMHQARAHLRAAPGFGWFLLSRLFGVMAIGILQTYTFYLLQDVMQVSNPAAAAGGLLIVIGGAIVAGVYPAGRLSDKVGRKPVLIFAGLLGAAAIFSLSFFRSYGTVLWLGGGLGVAIGAFLSVSWALATDLVPSGKEARYLGLTNLATAGAAALARLAGPAVDFFNARQAGRGYFFLLVLCSFYFLAAAALVLKVKEKGNTVLREKLVKVI